MGNFWVMLTHLHALAGPAMTLLYPLYASVVAMESESKEDDQQWLAYWILYSFLALMEMVMQPVLEHVGLWYDVKLVMVAWLVLPQFKGAALVYERFVKQKFINGIVRPKKKSMFHKSVGASQMENHYDN